MLKMPEALYCELCGSPIEGRAYKVNIDGVSLTVCEKCYRKQIQKSTSKVNAEDEKKNSQIQKPKMQEKKKKKEEIEYEVVDDYYIKIKNAREKLGLTLLALSQKVMEKESVLRRIEQGRLRPSIELSKRLEKALGIKLLEPVIEEKKEEVSEEASLNELTLGDVANLKKRR